MYDTIFAPVTFIGPSAVSVFRVSGRDSASVLRFLTKEKKLPLDRTLVLKKIYYPDDRNTILDLCLVCWMPEPNSYTGEDCFEIHCHGGVSTSQAFIKTLSKIKGLRFAEAGEFSKRALINGKMNLVKAEAINEIITAETENQRNLSVRQLTRGLSIPLNVWRKEIINILSKIEASIDFSDEESVPSKIDINKDLKDILEKINKVLKEGNKLDIISNGIKVTLTGPPNSGKSSLFNFFIKKEKAIVTKIAGTTRDVLEKKINFKGFQIIFADTAGIRKTKSIIEQEGIKKAIKTARDSDLVLNVFDISKKGNNSVKTTTIRKWNVYNKIDKINKHNFKKQLLEKKEFFVSAKTGYGTEDLLQAIHSYILNKTKSDDKDTFFYTNARQKYDLEKALQNIQSAIDEKSIEIIAEYLRLAAYNLERILGKVDIEDVLDNIFSNFCIGK